MKLEFCELLLNNNLKQKIINIALKNDKEECCGYIFGKKNKCESIFEVDNIHKDKINFFFMNPHTQIKALDKCNKLGLRIIGVFHSHINELAYPSKYDIEFITKNTFYIIFSVSEYYKNKKDFLRIFIYKDKLEELKIREDENNA